METTVIYVATNSVRYATSSEKEMQTTQLFVTNVLRTLHWLMMEPAFVIKDLTSLNKRENALDVRTSVPNVKRLTTSPVQSALQDSISSHLIEYVSITVQLALSPTMTPKSVTTT